MARMTMSTRNLGATKAALAQYSANARDRAKKVVFASGSRVHETALSLCPFDVSRIVTIDGVAEDRDDFHMIDHLNLRFTPKGLGYEVGFDERKFAAAGQPFYPIFTEFGTRYMAAQPCVFPAIEAERPRFKRDLAAALRPRRPETRGV